ncbi:type I methionyl aminopeptidase [Candidatus Nomurabacteria bacterium]|nr:type I methionyl aminopeptidase [Candidatus Nomurabacteria bacterium]
MSIIIKTPQELEHIREAGKRLGEVVFKVSQKVAPGVTTNELDDYAEQLIRDMGDKPAFKNYQPEGASYPFPSTLCISVNDQIVHGIASDYALKAGDIVTIDCGMSHHGVFTDHAVTVPVGNISDEAQKLLNDTRESLRIAIEKAHVGNHIGDIGAAVQKFVAGRYGIVKGLAGHGVGRYIHEDPYIPNYGKAGTGAELKPGMVIAIEPMLTLGRDDFIVEDDDWTLSTSDGTLAAHFEHTVIITENGPEVVTQI